MTGRARLSRSGQPPKIGIVHLGPGAFFRAFNAPFTQDAMDIAGGDWGILAVSLRSPAARDALSPQGGVYHAVTKQDGGLAPRLIKAVTDVWVAPDDPRAVVEAMADADVRIVSLTITEKGYCKSAETGGLDLDHPDIVHDLASRDQPVSVVGFIVAALMARKTRGAGAFTVLSCDNLPSNGALVRRLVLEFAGQIDSDLTEWIETHATFPSTMVDRITPATTETDLDALAQLTGVQDDAAVFHEDFRQWVIEDSFAAGRPAWDEAGAQIVPSVDAHEMMKLRCLNGTHSMLAYLGYLAGYETIADTVADLAFAALCERAWREEIIPTLPPPEGENVHIYCDTLIARYRDTSIRHRTWQIAMDGSQKLPQRILGTIADNIAAGRATPCLILTVAAWMRYVGGIDEQGAPIDVRDPLAADLRAACDASDGTAELVSELMSVAAIFPAGLRQHDAFRNAVADASDRLIRDGAQATVRSL
ncbi:mannitol dehydrogenase family protein [Yoonia sp. 208BN28-4]|uniref:mannitol dehydrogenase family protein n=1 Tax=Yoonia sp. 208BN28-4 TaxID=3126505 RepID=UPI00309E08F2